jgi:hypothetical protein
MQDTKRENQLLETLLLLKEESQRLIRRHREIQDEFHSAMHELNVLRKNRQWQCGEETFAEFDAPALPDQKSAGWGAMGADIARVSAQKPAHRDAKNRRRSNGG